MRELPEPDTHCFDDDTGKDVWSHSRDQVLAIQKQAYEDGLRDAAKMCADMKSSYETPTEKDPYQRALHDGVFAACKALEEAMLTASQKEQQ